MVDVQLKITINCTIIINRSENQTWQRSIRGLIFSNLWTRIFNPCKLPRSSIRKKKEKKRKRKKYPICGNSSTFSERRNNDSKIGNREELYASRKFAVPMRKETLVIRFVPCFDPPFPCTAQQFNNVKTSLPTGDCKFHCLPCCDEPSIELRATITRFLLERNVSTCAH